MIYTIYAYITQCALLCNTHVKTPPHIGSGASVRGEESVLMFGLGVSSGPRALPQCGFVNRSRWTPRAARFSHTPRPEISPEVGRPRGLLRLESQAFIWRGSMCFAHSGVSDASVRVRPKVLSRFSSTGCACAYFRCNKGLLSRQVCDYPLARSFASRSHHVPHET